jgi:hypothetical protein
VQFGHRPGIAADLIRQADCSSLDGIDEEHSATIAEKNHFDNQHCREFYFGEVTSQM